MLYDRACPGCKIGTMSKVWEWGNKDNLHSHEVYGCSVCGVMLIDRHGGNRGISTVLFKDGGISILPGRRGD